MNADRNSVDFSRRWRYIRAALLTSTALLPWIISNQAHGRNLNSTGAVAPATAAQMAAGLAAQQAAAAGEQAQASLSRAAAALAAARKAQQDAAAAAAQAVATSVNGVAVNGLMPLGGVTAQNACGDSCSTLQLNTPTSWKNVNTSFTQTVKDGQYTVDITPTQQKAILNWETFNVGRNTTVKFEQQSADWTVLNRVTDPSGSPTQILGQISAKGGVYVINRNGIIFGGGAQVNVHALVASTLDVGALGTTQDARDQFFLGTGINGANAFSVAPTLQPSDPGYAAENNRWGDVTVKAGASISASTVDLDSPGFVYLFGRNIDNSGALAAPAGEVALVAARTIDLVSGGYWKLPSTVLPANVNYRGTDFQITQFADTYLRSSTPPGLALTNAYTAGTGLVTNNGLIDTPRGIAMMNGDRIAIGSTGVISADTGITRNSMVLLRAATSIDLEGTIRALAYDDPLTSSLPQGGSAGSTVQSFLPAYLELSAQSTVTVGSSGLISAPSATVVLRAIDLGPSLSLNGQALYTNAAQNAKISLFGSQGNALALNPSTTSSQQVLLQSGATIDVAGLQDVELPASYNFIGFKPLGNQFPDMPLQRNGALYGQTLWIDIRASGTRSDGTAWVGTPVADASGTISNYGRSIQQLMATGGSVSLQTDLTSTSGTIPDRSVIAQSGSVINVAGGKVTFLPGMVPTTVLLGADGRRYSIENADPNMTYLGIAGQFSVNHSRWGVTETWSTATQTYAPGYTEGHDAGGITISTVTPQLQGEMYFGSMAGERQISLGLKPSATAVVSNASAPDLLAKAPSKDDVINVQSKGDELPSQGYLLLNIPNSVVIGTSADLTPGQLGISNQVAHISGVSDPSQFAPIVKGADFNPTSGYQTILSASTLSSYGLSLLRIKANDLLVAHNSANDASSVPDLGLAAGGMFSGMAGGAISIVGNVAAAGGQISLVTDAFAANNSLFPNWFSPVVAGKADIFVDGVLDVSGRWVNNTGQFGPDITGPGYIDGGSISIATNKSDIKNAGLDTTGSISLAQQSLLDASSGGYISATGVAKTASPGVMAGRGGSISLHLYQGSLDWAPPSGGAGPLQPTRGNVAQLQLDGTLQAYGFERGGTLTLGAAKTITIDSTAQADANSGIVTSSIGGNAGMTAVTLAASRLTDGGFGAYVIESTPDGWTAATPTITVAAGVNLALQQQNLASLADYTGVATGSKIGRLAPLARLPDDQRKPVDLTLKSNNILLDTGAVIATDAQARVSLGGTPDYDPKDPSPDRAAQNVLLRGSVIAHAGTVSVNALKTWLGPQAKIDVSGTFVANSRFGLANGPATSGTVLSGGSFTVEASVPSVLAPGSTNTYVTDVVPTGSYVVAETGAQVDVSGYAATIQTQNSPGASVQSWSDAGIVKIDAAAFAWGGTFKAMGGRLPDGTQVLAAEGKTPVANGGGIILGGGAMLLQQDSTNITAALSGILSGGPATLADLANKSSSLVNQLKSASGTSSSIFAAVDRLKAFEQVFLYSGTAQNGSARIFTGLTGTTYGLAAPSFSPLAISGSVTWASDDGLSRLYIGASAIGSTTPGSTVTLAAPYMLLTGGSGVASTSSSSLYLGFERTKAGDPKSDVIIARTIDVEGAAFAGFNDIELKSLGDIRLSTPKVADGLVSAATSTSASVSTDLARFPGQLAAGGADLVLDAQRIYPVSAVDFTIQTTGNVKLQATAGGRSDIPLSAGGSLTVYAATIDQNGNVFAPLGKITLGDDGTASGNSSKVKTTSVTLEPGSLTSVTLADTVVPYGETVDGVNWYYNASLHPLLAAASGSEPVLPSKGLVLNATGVAVKQGATIDTRGGGDLQAMEWVKGKGGSRDTLTTTPKGQTVYALLPSYNDAVAAFDLHFTTTRSLDGGQTITAGDVYPLAGQQVYLDGGNGFPAGTYTLYPAHYATLPGALRLVDYGNNLGRNIPSGTTLPDGTVLVSGQYTQSVRAAAHSSGSELFAIQTGAVWRQYSEYSFNTANSYFTAKANHEGSAVPRLPVDAGRIAVVAQQELLLAGTEVAQPAPGGRSGEFDISGGKLAVLSPGVNQQPFKDAGYVVVLSDQLNGFESVLIGGLRSDTATGTLITGTAAEIVVDTPVDPATQAGGLSVPEILLVTQPGSRQQTISQAFQVNYNGNWFDGTSQFSATVPAGGGAITIATGSVISTSGIVHTGAGRNYYLAANPSGYTTAQQVAAAVRGTLDSTGTVITGAGLENLPVSVPSLGFGTNPSAAALTSYSYGNTSSQPGLGALFVATQDSTLAVSGPAGTPQSAPLTIQFATLVGFAVRPSDGSNGPVRVTLPGDDVGRVAIEAGARITTNSLFMQATATTSNIVLNQPTPNNPNAPAATITANQAKLIGRSIGIGASTRDSLILSQANLAQLASVKNLSLRALGGDITFYNSDLTQTGMQALTLDARAITGTGGDSRIQIGGTVTLVNGSGATGTSALGGKTGSLNISAADVELGGGAQTIAGFSQVNFTASDQLLVSGAGALTLGTGSDVVGLQVITPRILVGASTSKGGGSFVVATSGAVRIGDVANASARTYPPQDSNNTGGSLTIQGGSVRVGGFADDQNNLHLGNLIQAQAGSITLEATSGDVTLDHNAYLSARGYAKTFVDTTTYLPGGKVVLKADAGNVITRGASDPTAVSDASVIDVAQPDAAMGYGGQIQILATAGRASLFGDLRGRGGNGLGGSFKVDANSLEVDSNVPFDPNTKLDALANKLLAGGLSGEIDVHTRTGNLILSEGYTLKGNSVTLTADDTNWDSANAAQQFGQIILKGTIDARGYAGTTADGTGQAGGQVSLFGANQVTLASTGSINASTAHADERGGDVTIGIGWGASSWNAATRSGGIDLRPGSLIDVHGGTKGGLSGGTVLLRAPNDGANDVKIAQISSTITGARSVTIESFVSFSTNGQGGIDTSALGWNGILDPGKVQTTTNLQVSSVNVPPGSGGSYTDVPDVTITAPATAATGLKSISISPTSSWYHLDPNTTADVVIEAPAGGVAATGTVKTDANGIPTFTITNPGSGFSGAPATIRFYRDGQLLLTSRMAGSDFASVVMTAAGQAQGTAVMGIKSISVSPASSWFHLDPNVTASIVIEAPAGGVDAIGTATTDANGVPTLTITNPGSGFTSAPATIRAYRNGQLFLTAHVTRSDFASMVMTVVGVNVTNAGAGYAIDPTKGGTDYPTATFSGGGSGSTQAVTVTADLGTFAAVTLRQYVQGNWAYNTNTDVRSYGFGGAVDRLLNPLAARVGASVAHLRPGVELVNPNGDITIASNWNLAAGTAGNLQPGQYNIKSSDGTTYTTNFSYFDPNTSYVNFAYRYLANYGNAAAPNYVPEAGALTLRAFNNINVNASISDGFFQFRDYLDSSRNQNSVNFNTPNGYMEAVQDYLGSSAYNVSRIIDGVYKLNDYRTAPLAPYNTVANSNGVSPSALNLAEADLFPHSLNVCVSRCGFDTAATVQVSNPGSWSYRLTAGADFASVNPNAMQSLDAVGKRNAGDVIVNGHVVTNNAIMPNFAINLPTMVRTGTGDIAIAAARDVKLVDTAAPGVIYAAGVNTASYANPYAVDISGNVSVPAQNVDGFLEPQVLAYATSSSNRIANVFGPPTAAAFPTEGGDVSVVAQRDVKGYRDVTTVTRNFGGSTTVLWNAYYTPWLLADAGGAPSAVASTLGAGVFAPSSSGIASQTAWWIQYGSFREGIASAGGNVTVTAGRDLVDVSVSLPTTGRITGGLASLNSGAISTPQAHVYGSGNMEVRAGRNLLGGSYYEGSGHATILVNGMVDQNGTITIKTLTNNVPNTLPNYTLLAVDTGQISMISGGSMAIGGVVNPAELHLQSGNAANPNPLGAQVGLLMNTYGPDSRVSLTAITGNLNIAMPQTVGTTAWITGLTYPASFTAVAASGDITTKGLVTNSTTLNPNLPGIVLTGSDKGRFELLAQGSIDLTGSYTNLLTFAPSISAGPSLLDGAFDPYQPNNGMTGAFSTAVLAHQDDHDTNPARIFAVSGNISAVGTMSSIVPPGKITSAVPTDYVRVELNRPAKIYAGRDIINLNLIAQNVAADDVTTIAAGRDIVYNYVGAKNPLNPGTILGGPGLQIAGPGFLVVQAGRDLGPFLPVTRDSNIYTQGQEGIASLANASLWSVGNRYVSQGSAGLYDLQLLGSFSATTKKRNERLPSAGADLVVLFGVSNGINYDGYVTTDPVTNQATYHPGVIATYINPNNASNVTLGELKDFLARIGRPATTDAAAWNIFKSLPQDLQHVFANQVFFAELKAVGKEQTATSGQYQRGYQMINTMFPSDFGYTQNALGGGANGANALQHTGDLDMLHASIQTRLGGDISFFGPGGSIRVGSLALEPNNLLKQNDLGILTLGGGAINTFTDSSVLVNSSRVMTQQGGDILMWSSNGDLDAGRGAQTTLSLPPLQVVFNSDDYQSVDLGGLVSGAGIAVVQSSKLAAASNAYLLAPRGKVDAGEAGIRVSGNLVVAAVQVVNAGNIQVGGTSTGVPTVSVPNVGALSSASSTAGAAAKPTEPPTAAGSNDRASVFIVEVVGYGGGDTGGQDAAPAGAASGDDDSERRRAAGQ